MGDDVKDNDSFYVLEEGTLDLEALTIGDLDSKNNNPKFPRLHTLSNNLGVQSIRKHNHLVPPPGWSFPEQRSSLSTFYKKDIKEKYKNTKILQR